MIDSLQAYPEYKDSGLPWFGAIPSHWELPRLGHILHERGEVNKNGEVTEVLSLLRDRGVIPYADKGNIGNKKSEDITRYKIVRPRDIVVNCMNVIIGSVGLSRYTGCLSPVYYVLRTRYSHDLPEYCDAVFKIKPFQRSLTRIGKGILAHRMRIPMELLKCELMPRPPADEQARIVRYLNEIDRHIARFIRNRRRLIEVLNEQKQAIINRAVTRGLDPNAPLKPSGVDWLGDIPEHWEVCPLCSFAQPKSITNCPERELLSVYLDKGVIRFSDVSEKRTNPTSNDLSNYQAVDPGDFVLNNQQAWRGSVGVSQYTGIVSPAYLVLALNPNMESRFADYLLRGKAMVAQYLVSSKGVGSIQRNLYWPHLKRVIAPVPPHREQADTVKHLDRATRGIDKAIGRTQKEIDLIREYRTRLIADVVTGKVDVRDLAPPPGSDELEETVDELEPLDDAEGELEEDALAGEVAHAED